MPTLSIKSVKGVRGSCYADVGELRLPCVHDYWRCGRNKLEYCDPSYDETSPKWEEFLQALCETKMVVLCGTRDERTFERDGYIGIFGIDDVQSGEALTFKFVSRLDCQLNARASQQVG